MASRQTGDGHGDDGANAAQTSEFGYAMVRVDVRGIGGSPGIFDPWGISRTRDIDADAEGNGERPPT